MLANNSTYTYTVDQFNNTKTTPRGTFQLFGKPEVYISNMMITMTEALDSLAQVATDQLFGFDTASLLTPQLARQVPQLNAEEFSFVQAGMDEPTNIFGEPVDFHDPSVPGT